MSVDGGRTMTRQPGRFALTLATCLLVLVGLSSPGTAAAEDREDAVKLADQAFDLMEDGEFEQAARLYERAVELYYSPVIALYWAKAEAKRGRLVEARAIVHTIENEPMPDDAKPSWTKAVEDAAIFGVELDGRIPTVSITLKGARPAELTLDGKPIDDAESNVKVNPGEGTDTFGVRS